MISWSTIAYGAAPSALLAGALVAFAARGNRIPAGIAAALGAAAGPIAWNAILHATHASACTAALSPRSLMLPSDDVLDLLLQSSPPERRLTRDGEVGRKLRAAPDTNR